MSNLILLDILGTDGDLTLKDVKKSHQTIMNRERMIINDIYRAVKYFNQVFRKRRTSLMENSNKSEMGTYTKKSYWWRDECRKITKDKRKGIITNY